MFLSSNKTFGLMRPFGKACFGKGYPVSADFLKAKTVTHLPTEKTSRHKFQIFTQPSEKIFPNFQLFSFSFQPDLSSQQNQINK